MVRVPCGRRARGFEFLGGASPGGGRGARVRVCLGGAGEDAWEHAVHERFAAGETAAGDADAGLDGHDYEGGCPVPCVLLEMTGRWAIEERTEDVVGREV